MANELPPKDCVGQEYTKAEALSLDGLDDLQHLRSEFIIPTKNDLKRRTLSQQGATLSHNLY